MDILGGGFHMGTSELSCPHGRPGRRGEPCWALLGVPT